jgi:hypothetical protein
MNALLEPYITISWIITILKGHLTDSLQVTEACRMTHAGLILLGAQLHDYQPQIIYRIEYTPTLPRIKHHQPIQ